jgi:hypothetical protein
LLKLAVLDARGVFVIACRYASVAALLTMIGGRPVAAQDGANATIQLPLRMHVDVPAVNATLGPNPPLVVGGWALDSSSVFDAGIDAVHVWAVPASGPFVFIGAATIGVSRPDVAAFYGFQFGASGFHLEATTVPAPGTYTLQVFARRAATGTFDIVEQVPITIRGVTLSDLLPCASGHVPSFDGTAWGCSSNAGAQGPAGPTGPTGPAGPAGPAGVPCAGCVDNASLQPIAGAGLVANSATTATSSNTANTIVARDGSGNFSAGTITASLSGSATSFSGALAGDVTGTQGATVVGSVGGATAASVAAATTLANGATSANTASAIVRRDGSGGFSAGALTLSGLFSHASDDGLLSTGTFGSGSIPATGAGTRLMWYPRKAAIRAGRVTGTDWDDASIGDYSAAFGFNATASGSGSVAGGSGASASGSFSAALGRSAASGSDSFAAGFSNLASGVSAIAMGNDSLASGSPSTAIGFNVTASGHYSTAIGAEASTNGMEGSFVYGDRSTSSDVTATGANQFVVRAAGGTTFYSASDLSTGVTLASGGGAWASVSDAAMKENWKDLDGESILGKLAAMRIGEWNYKTQPATIRHAGPTAQDFHAAFGLGEDPKRISTIDADGIALAAIQALEKRTRELDAAAKAIAALQAHIEQLEKRLAQLEAVRPSGER